MLLTLKGTDGPVVIETANICWIGRAIDMKSGQPMLGYSTIVYPGGAGVGVRGTPQEVKEAIGKAKEITFDNSQPMDASNHN